MLREFYHLLKERKYSGRINILLTNRCSENCSFCFARELMSRGGSDMSLKDYELLLDFLKKEGVKEISLMGGEPSLHKDFGKMIGLAFDRGMIIDLFTNGYAQNLERMIDKIRTYHINITTPSYQKNCKYRKKIINLIGKIIRGGSAVSLEMTIDRFDEKYYVNLLELVGKMIEKCSVRIGVDGYFIKLGGFDIKRNLVMGKMVVNLVKKLKKEGVSGIWLSEMYPCMFSRGQIDWFKSQNEIIINGWGCWSKRSSLDIRTDLKVIRCFYQDCKDGVEIGGGLKKPEEILEGKRQKISDGLLPDVCRNCDYWGDCPGPCLVKV